MTPVNKEIRLINFGIDMAIIKMLTSIIKYIFGLNIEHNIVYFLIFLCYYIILESLLGQTIGKIITKTKVVNTRNTKPGFKRIILRTILRLNPLDLYSYLFGTEIGAHDRLSRTIIIEKPEHNLANK